MKRRVVLTVDDSMTILRSLKVVLAGAGYEVLEASDGIEALELLQKYQVNMVITDINMPRMDGITLCREIRNSRVHRFTPVLMLTTETQAAKKELARQAGASGWITKPFTGEQLLGVMKKLGV